MFMCCGTPSNADDEQITPIQNAPELTDNFGSSVPPEEQRDVAKARDAIERGSQISREVFAQALQKLLTLAINGYPRAVRSTLAKRNELLRAQGGGLEQQQDAAAEALRASAAKMSEEAATWVLGLVPYVGLPSSVLYPTWCALRRVCLLGALYGHDLDSEVTKAKILHAFCGMRAVPVAELVLETAVQAVWSKIAGPAASVIPVGVLTSKVANVEGHVMGLVGKENFQEGRRDVAEAEYQELLDAEPRLEDYLALARDGVAYAMLTTWALGRDSALMALDAKRRDEALAATLHAGRSAAAGGKVAAGTVIALAGSAAAAAPGVAAAMADKTRAGLEKGLATGSTLVGSLTGTSAKPPG